ncbi:hypothetical protein Pelo_13019 [Pelomyxa schiedti]|nr:hypothetical protein Pelo_13019 [Pelomyxa schiedti]
MAKELVEGGDTPWCGCELLRWPAGDRDVIDDLREIRYSGTVSCSLLYDACKGGNLEVVRWVMSSFRDVGTAAWEFPMPFRAAVRWGRLDVVKWLNSSTGSVPACLEMLRYNADDCSLANFVASQSLEVVKFCTELFCGYEPNENRDEILEKFIEYCPIGCDVDEGCQWIKDKFSLTKEHCPSLSLISSFKNAKGFKWLINTFSLKPIQEELRCACTDIADQELTEWLITNFSDSVGPVETDTLISACGNKKDSVSVLQVLISNLRTPLKEEEMTQCLVASLSRSNTSIAEWLEKKFHVMDHVNSVPRLTDETFTKVCSSPNGSGIGGIQWFISNCAVTNISERTVIDAIRFFSTEKKILPMLLLLKTFEVSIVSDNDKANMVHIIVSRGNLPQAKQIVSRVSFSSENVAQGLSQGGRKSGKVVKWFIQQFHLNESQVKRNDNRLLFKLIDGNKTSCAEWLIRKFHIGAMTDMHGIDASVSLVCTWKMLLRVFPEMTLSFAKRYLWEYATAFHLHLKASRKMLGLTDADLVAEDDFSYLWTNAWIP